MTRDHESAVPTPVISDPALQRRPSLRRPDSQVSAIPSREAGGGSDWSLVACAFDALGQGLLVCEGGGRRHANAAYRALVRLAPDGERIRGSSERLGLTLLQEDLSGTGRPRRSRVVHIRTGRHWYQLRGTRMAATRAKGAAALVTVVRWPLEPPTEGVLRQRFGLTARQALVARLLAERRTNKEIARQLDISPHTAKRHTEQVLLKMGVSSRRSVEELLKRLLTTRPHALRSTA